VRTLAVDLQSAVVQDARGNRTTISLDGSGNPKVVQPPTGGWL